MSLPNFKSVTPTDFQVDVFGYDVRGTPRTRYALYGPRLLWGDSVSVSQVTEQLNRSVEFDANIYNSASFRLEGATATQRRAITLELNAVLLRSSYTSSGSTYPLSVAVTYGGNLFGWAGQGNYVCMQDDVAFDFLSSVETTATSAGAIPMRGADRVDVVLAYTNPFDALRLEVTGTSEREDIFTLSSIEAQQIGYNFWECGAFVYDVNDTTVFTTSGSGKSRLSAQRSFGELLNCGGEQPRTAEVNDQITLGFGVFTNGFPGDTFTLNVKVLLRDQEKLSQDLVFTLTDGDLSAIYPAAPNSSEPKLEITPPAPGVPQDIAPGTHVTFDLTYRFPIFQPVVGQRR
ncbi:uncharacterized protein LOC119111587 [Pollicipes pollicipes]|uniref:uncharacterized protein LOC119111587 n=1 Tax=Pollicipes pollicipes TaxID=41117 RepID=UPI0018855377|nr:uncharacterized protein LOC119111587 [Pollicipes pollicipes]